MFFIRKISSMLQLAMVMKLYLYNNMLIEYWIAWFNNRGAYLYDGNRVIDLFLDSQDNTRRKINLSSWRSFLGTKPAIAYDAQEKILMIIDNLAASACNIRIL